MTYNDGTNTYTTTYTYDQAGQLTSVLDGQTGILYKYVYDEHGNILQMSSYSVASDGSTSLIETKTMAYSSMVLTNVYSTVSGSRTYQSDAMGNPTKMAKNGITYTLTWGQGRMLTRISQNTANNTQYSYDADGLRTKKIVKSAGVSTTTEYLWGNNGLAGMKTSLGTVVVLYDDEGSPIGFTLNGTAYTYVKNLQGDILRILDTSGNTVVSYTYDPWGVPTISGNTKLAAVNPCSYRGYDYDEETGYYYLQSRYYDPEVGRFLNLDDSAMLFIFAHELGAANLLEYCGNNPINDLDIAGYLSLNELLTSVKNFVGKIKDSLWGYIKGSFIYNRSKKTVSIRTSVVAAAIDSLVIISMRSATYAAINQGMKILLNNNTIRKAFVKEMFNFFVYQTAGKVVLKVIVKIGFSVAGISCTNAVFESLFSDYIGKIIASKNSFLSAPISLISAFSSFGGIVAFFFDWMDGSRNDYVTLQVKK